MQFSWLIKARLRRTNIYIYLLEIRLRIYDSFSLKDKRKTVKSILDFSRKNLNISAAEIGSLEIYNLADLAFVAVSNDNELSKAVLEKVIKKIETNYQAEIVYENLERLV